MPTKKHKTRKKKGLSGIGVMGKRIMAKARQISREHPNKAWTSCVGAAAKSLKK